MKSLVVKMIVHTVIYTAIVVALYIIYSPLNKHPKNQSGTSSQFVYQNF